MAELKKDFNLTISNFQPSNWTTWTSQIKTVYRSNNDLRNTILFHFVNVFKA